MIAARHLVVGLCAAWFCLGVQAQVTRCTDARTGKVSYTDGLCNSGEAVREVKIRPTHEEILRIQQFYAEERERNRQRLQADHGAAQADRQRAADHQRALADYSPRPYDHARSPGCAGSRGAYDLLRIQQDHRSTREYGPLKEAAERRMDMDCMGPEAYAERERQRERDRREQEYREAAQRRETALLDQLERDRYAREERQRERDRERQQREREEARRDQERREQADRDRRDRERGHARQGEERRKQQMEQEREQQARRDQAERDNRAAADRRRNESRSVQSGLGASSTGWRGGLRSSP